MRLIKRALRGEDRTLAASGGFAASFNGKPLVRRSLTMSERKSKSPYQRKYKSPFPYHGVPLHSATAQGVVQRGVPVTEENLSKWEASRGVRRTPRRNRRITNA